jgi:hypothetical protein
MRKTIFWILTGLFAAFMLFSAYGGLQPDGLKVFADLGYPAYFATIISVAKVLGAIALVFRRFPTLTEWAYAGFAFDIIGAGWSMVASGMGWASALTMLPFLAALFASYFLAPDRGCGCAKCAGGACATCRA